MADLLSNPLGVTSREHQWPSDPNINPKNQADVASTSRPTDPLQSLCDLFEGSRRGRSPRHPDAFIPTGNTPSNEIQNEDILGDDQNNTRVENRVPSNEIRAEDVSREEGCEDQNNTRGKKQALTPDVENALKASIEGLAGQRTRKQLANSLNISVSTLDELRRKGLDLSFMLSNKKAKHSTPSTSSAASVASVSAAVASSLASSLAATLSSALAPLLATSLEPLLATTLTNLPSSSLDQGNEFKSLSIYDKHELKAMEIQNLDDDVIMAFDAAWNSTCKVKDGVMLVPSGFTFLLQPIEFDGIRCQSNIIFQVDGKIVAPSNKSDWKSIDFEWILFTEISNGITLKGNGTIDGQGEDWWNHATLEDDNEDTNYDLIHIHKEIGGSNSKRNRRPHALRIANSVNVTVTGITIQNSPKFHIFIGTCQQVNIFNFTVSSPKESPNTNGIHLSRTHQVVIYYSTLAAGDDCISIQLGTSNVQIYDVHCKPGHGYSIGGLGFDKNVAQVSNVSVVNSTISDSLTGVRIKTWQDCLLSEAQPPALPPIAQLPAMPQKLF
ncbi:hypothetical protein RD792_004269 [Penstemon davidsonii]|uniref:Polygalacturonase n=1 Tax=Penstemon davidsonii TaxID=160366 RepID=A0ABR0DH02_9LAMI|nr:hypothetical protein RD792_004269 [Penstemon davidsonii]